MSTQHFVKPKIKEYFPFPLPFFHVTVEDWPRKKAALEKLVDWKDPSCYFNDHFTDYHKNLANDEPYGRPKYLTDFIDILKPELMGIAELLKCNINIKSLWAQRYLRNNHMRPHTHGVADFSAVLYHEFANDHQATEFWAPYKNPLTTFDYVHTPEVEEGDLVIFPSTIIHYAVPNDSDQQRTIFSFNFRGTDIEFNKE
jgi:hypothetical protein